VVLILYEVKGKIPGTHPHHPDSWYSPPPPNSWYPPPPPGFLVSAPTAPFLVCAPTTRFLVSAPPPSSWHSPPPPGSWYPPPPPRFLVSAPKFDPPQPQAPSARQYTSLGRSPRYSHQLPRPSAEGATHNRPHRQHNQCRSPTPKRTSNINQPTPTFRASNLETP
jgi:hypothetical protein